MTFDREFERQDPQDSQEILSISDKFYNQTALTPNIKEIISNIQLKKHTRLVSSDKKKSSNASLIKATLSVKNRKSADELELSGFQPEFNQSIGLSFSEFEAGSNFLYEGSKNTNFKMLGSQQQLNISAIPFSTRSNQFSNLESTKNFGFNWETKGKFNNHQGDLMSFNSNENKQDLRIPEISSKCSNYINQDDFRLKVFMQGLFLILKNQK